MLKIKDSGHWKTVDEIKIKIAGVWKTSLNTFMKIAGHWVNINDFASTHVEYDGTLGTEADGSRYMVNKLDPTKFKAPVYSGKYNKLLYSSYSNTGKVNIPVNHTVDTVNYATGVVTGHIVTDLGNGKYKLVKTKDAAESFSVGVVANTPVGLSLSIAVEGCTYDSAFFNNENRAGSSNRFVKIAKDGDVSTSPGTSNLVWFGGIAGTEVTIKINYLSKIVPLGAVAYLDAKIGKMNQDTSDPALLGAELIDDPNFQDPTKWSKPALIKNGKLDYSVDDGDVNCLQLTGVHIDDGIRLRTLVDVETPGLGNVTRFWGTCSATYACSVGLKGVKDAISSRLYCGSHLKKLGLVKGRPTSKIVLNSYSVKPVLMGTLDKYPVHTLQEFPLSDFIVLKTGKFTQADLDIFTASPEKIIKWGEGVDIGTSIQKTADDKVYLASGGGVYVELNTPAPVLSTEYYKGTWKAEGLGNFNVTTNPDNTVTIDYTGTHRWEFIGSEILSNSYAIGDAFLVDIEIEVLETIGDVASLTLGSKTRYAQVILIALDNAKPGTYSYKGYVALGKSVVPSIRIQVGHRRFKVKIKRCSIRKADLSTAIVVKGVYRNNNVGVKGIQQTEIVTDEYGIPTGLSTHIEGAHDGRWVKLPLADRTKQHHDITKCLKRLHGNMGQIDEEECTP